MAEKDKINSLYDLPSIEQETNAVLDALDKVVQSIKKLSKTGANLNLTAGYAEAQAAAQAAKIATEELKRERAELQKQAAAMAAKFSADAAAQRAATQQLLDAERQRQAQGRTAAQDANTAAAQARANAQSLLDLERQRQQQNRTAAELAQQAARTAREEANARAAQARAEAAARRANNANIQHEAGSLNELRQRLREATRAFDAMGTAQRAALGPEAIRDIQQLQTEIRRLEGITGRNQRNVGNYANSIVGGFKGLIGTLGVAYGANEIVQAIFNTTVQLDSQNIALQNVSKTTLEFERNQRFLRETSSRLGLNLLGTTNAFKGFYAASTQAGLSTKEARRIFASASEAASVLKLSQDDVNGVLLAFGQILGKGKVQAEELRGQIGERIPGAFAIAARAIGKTQEELDKMLKNGELIATDFLPKFATELQKSFSLGGESAVGLQASINRLSNEFSALISNNQSGLNKFFTGLIDLATKTISVFDRFITTLNASGFNSDRALKGALLSASDLAELARQTSNPVIGKTYADAFKEGLKNAVAAAKKEQISFIDVFSDQSAADQAKSLTDLREALAATQAEYKKLSKEKGIDSEESISAAISIQALSYRLKGFNQVLTEASVKSKKTTIGLTEAELNAQARLQERYDKALFEQDKFNLQTQIERQKIIADNEKNSYYDRMQAAENYYALKNQLAELETQADKKRIKIEIGRNRAANVELATADSKLRYEQGKNVDELGKLIAKITDDNADERTKSIMNAYKKEAEVIGKAQNEELANTRAFYDAGKIDKETYELEKLRINNKYAILALQAELDTQQQLIDLQKLRGVDTADAEAKLLAIKNKIRDLDLKYTEDTEKRKTAAENAELKRREELRKQEISMIKQLQGESIKAFTAIFTAQFENQKNAIQDQIDALDEVTQKEIEAVNASTASEEEKAAKIQVINLRSQAQKEQLERRQRQIDQQKARFERLQSIAQIVAGTAVNIVKVFPNPVLIALAAAIGAAQLAQVLATPIPRYFLGAGVDGRPEHKGGLMQVNDGGKLEPIQTPDGNLYVAPKMNTILDAPAGTKVYPSFGRLFENNTALRQAPANVSTTKHHDDYTARAIANHAEKIVSGMKNGLVKVNIVNTAGGLKTSFQRGASSLQIYNQEINFGK